MFVLNSDVLHLPKSLLGACIPRMLPLIAQKLGINLTDSLSDNGSLGRLIRNQPDYKMQMTQGHAPTTVTRNVCYSESERKEEAKKILEKRLEKRESLGMRSLNSPS